MEGEKKAEMEEWKESGEGVQDKHGLDSAGDTSCERRSQAGVGSETKRNSERKRNILSRLCRVGLKGCRPTQRRKVNSSDLKNSCAVAVEFYWAVLHIYLASNEKINSATAVGCHRGHVTADEINKRR